MKINQLLAFVALACLSKASIFAQQGALGPNLSGNLQTNANFFMRDSAIGAANTPQYDRQLFGAESWLALNYSYKGFDGGVRFDFFSNSNLLNPTDSYSGQGIGRWWIKKKINKLELAGGYLYDQIGAGIIFRAYEERPLLIDNALFGVKTAYDINENWKARAFVGKQKFLFDRYGSALRGAAIDGEIKLDSAGRFKLLPGAGVVARTYDDLSANEIAAEVATYTKRDSIAPNYNTYAVSVHNSLIAGPFTWYAEAAFKTNDVIFDANAEKLNWNGKTSYGKLVDRPGHVFYTNLAFAKKGFGATVEFKRTKDFAFRTNPYVTGFRGMINFLPPMARQNTYRLTARYQPATQELGEQAFQGDFRYAFSKKLHASLNFSYIDDLNGQKLYREVYSELTWKPNKKTQIIGGLQRQEYSLFVYLLKSKDDPILKSWVPYGEVLYKFSRKKSLRVEAQYMAAHQDFGSWAFALAELSFAPKWIFTVSDMYKIKHENPSAYPAAKTKLDGIHFPTAGVVFTQGANRFSLDFVKQVEGIVCSGGICRYEPAFSGLRLKVNSNF